LEIDAQGSDWRIPRGNGTGFALTDEIVDAARRSGNDGVIFRNIREGDQGEYPLSTTFAAIRPGTVYSATTGDLLYSNAPTASSAPLAMNALERAGADLPMDLASRMARAREQGWDTDTPQYHATLAPDIQEFDSGKPVFFSRSAEFAGGHAGGNRDGAIIPAYLRGKYWNPEVDGWANLDVPEVRKKLDRLQELYPNSSPKEFLETSWQELEHPDMRPWLARNGYDGMIVREDGFYNTMVMDSRNIRSVNAAFDPAKSDSANLLAANAKSGAAVPLLQNALERAQPQVSKNLAGRDVYDFGGGTQVTMKDWPSGGRMVDNVYTDPQARGQGQARQAMEYILAEADQAGTPLKLAVSPGDTATDAQRLQQFYEGLGFDYLGGGYMSRDPRANPFTASAVPLAGETQDTENPLMSYLRMIGL
jgi:GNAT superfamily N-acetyltransferase